MYRHFNLLRGKFGAKRTIAVGGVLALALSVGSGPALAASTQGGSSSAQVQAQLQSAPAAVKAWVAGIERRGGQSLNLVHADYHQMKATTGKAAPAGVRPFDYPVGCGLWVDIYRDVDEIWSSSLSACTTTATEFQMYSGIALSAWWGWDEQVTDEDGNTNSESLDLAYYFNCGGSGTHNFQTVTNGYVEINGTEAQASAYDEIDNQTCP